MKGFVCGRCIMFVRMIDIISRKLPCICLRVNKKKPVFMFVCVIGGLITLLWLAVW